MEVRSTLAFRTSTRFGKSMRIKRRHSLCSATFPHRRMTAASMFMMTSEINSLSGEYRPRRSLSFTRQIPTQRRKNFLPRFAVDKSECLWVQPSRWEPAQTCSRDSLHFTTLTFRGDPLTLNREQVELSDKETPTPRLTFTVTLRREPSTPIPISFLRANRSLFRRL